MIKNYELLDEDYNGNQLIKLTCNPYSGIIYTYGRVRLVEEDELLVAHAAGCPLWLNVCLPLAAFPGRRALFPLLSSVALAQAPAFLSPPQVAVLSTDGVRKRVVVVDDSIVRGTTTRGLVALVRAAGAREAALRRADARRRDVPRHPEGRPDRLRRRRPDQCHRPGRHRPDWGSQCAASLWGW